MKSLLTKQAQYLKNADPILGLAINQNLPKLKTRGGVYEGLLSSIISQQISVAAASSVRERILKNFNGKFPEPLQLLEVDELILKSSGLSRQKISYFKSVSEHFIRERLDESKFHKMSDQEVIDDLTKIKGVGTWTAEMLLMFNLNRQNVFSVKDGGLLNAIYKLYKINPRKYKPKNLQSKILQISESWSPYKTLACRYLWNYKDGKI